MKKNNPTQNRPLPERFIPKLFLFCFLLPLSPAFTNAVQENSTILKTYLETPETSHKWSEKERGPNFSVLDLQSLEWKSHFWKHTVTIVDPAVDRFPETALLIIHLKGGGKTNPLLMTLANSIGMKIIALSNIPNQPLFGLREDALIAHTFEKTVETGDQTWPLLLPMTKAVTMAMNAIQEFSRENHSPIQNFIITGASKRGWTAWLAGSQDKRIIGIIPIVYDNLNLPAQLEHQMFMLGGYSKKISDYTDLNLPQLIHSETGRELVTIVDPFSYRNQITIPKLIINGTNDPYWTVDSLNIYYDDLPGPKNVLYLPNAGHNLRGCCPNKLS